MNVAEVKDAVRARDGMRCAECGMTNEEHKAVYSGKSLDVHRVTPGSKYTVDGCTTLCKRCHVRKPKRRYRTVFSGSRYWIGFKVSPPMGERVDAIASAYGMSMGAFMRMLLTDHLSAYEADHGRPRRRPRS